MYVTFISRAAMRLWARGAHVARQASDTADRRS